MTKQKDKFVDEVDKMFANSADRTLIYLTKGQWGWFVSQILGYDERESRLKAENAKLGKALERAVEILADEGAIFCPAIKVGYICNDGKGCDKLDSCETDICWREYLMKEEK